MKRDYMAEAVKAMKGGNYIIRADNNGKSYGGFQWSARGRWTKAPDWNTNKSCGGGLHGQCGENGGFIQGSRLVFCKTRGMHIALRNKVKVEEAMILLINELPEGLSVGGSLYLHGTPITSLPEGLSVGGYLDLHGTPITSLPEGLSVGGYLHLEGTPITSLPEGLSVGGSLYLHGTPITSLPEGLSVGGEIYGISNEVVL